MAIVLTLFGAMILVCIGVDPGHRTKGLVEGLKNRLRWSSVRWSDPVRRIGNQKS